MKKYLFINLLFLCCISLQSQVIVSSNQPNKTQKLLQKRGYGMFIHFGVNTFTFDEWSDGTTPVEKYNPTELDCDQWARVASEAGFRYILLTTKHHDGFCLWNSKYTDYDVASSPVKTDVVAALSRSCKKYGIKFAIYYSLWDRHEKCYNDPNPQLYIDYMKNQLTELLTNYGDIAELWLDGGWVAPVSRWGIDQLYSLTKKLQPKCAFGVNHTIVYEEGKGNKVMPDEMIKDNAYYFQYFPSDFRLWDPMIASKFDKKQYLHNGKSYYLPFEHTICLSKQWSWFQKSMPRPLREIDELEELFYWCTDNGNTLLLDVPPAYTGRIFEHEANQVISLGKRLGLKQGKPLPRNGKFISTNMKTLASSETNKNEAWRAVDGAMQTRWESADTLAQLIINLNPAEKFNKLSIFEYQDRKSGTDPRDYISVIRTNRIQEYNIDIWINDKWQTIYHSDESMDDCKVIRFPKKYSTCKIRLNVLKAIAPPSIFEFNVICNNK